LSGWLHTSLGKHIDLLTGYPFKSELYTESDNSIRLLRGDNVIQGDIRWRDAKRWAIELAEKLDNYFLQKGDVVIAMDRTWVKAGLKVAIIEDHDLPSLLVQRVARLRATKHLTQEYLLYLVSGYRFEQYVKGVQTETAVPHISSEQIREFSILLPPISEQKRIAEILSAWDEAIATTEKLIAAKQKRKKALMHKMLTGKRRFEKFRSDDWLTIKLGKVAEIRRGASPRPIDNPEYFSQTGRGWVRIADVTASKTYLTETTQYLSALGESKSVPVNPSDLIMSICATIGIPRIVTMEACIHDGFVVIRPRTSDFNRLFLYHFLDFISSKLAKSGQPGTQKNLNTTIVSNVEIPAISREEQNYIANALSLADEEIYKLEERLFQFQKQKRGLMQKLLTGEWRVKIEETAAQLTEIKI
jgi:type I restriction enzyme S subunit